MAVADKAYHAGAWPRCRKGLLSGSLLGRNWFSELRNNFSLLVSRLAIMVLLAIAITISTFLTWHFSALTGTQAVETTGNSFRSSLLAHAIEHVEVSLFQQSNGTGVLTDVLSSKLISEPVPYSDGLLLEGRTAIWLLFKNDGGLSSLSFATRDDLMIGYIRYANGTIKYAYSNGAGHAANVTVYMQDVDLVSGQPIGSPLAGIGPNTQESYTYLSALQKAEGSSGGIPNGSDAVAWEVAVGLQGSVIVRCGMAVRDASTGLVTGVAMSSAMLSRGFDVSQNVVAGTLYFVDSNWTLLGSSNSVEPSGTSAFASATDVIRQTAQLVYAAGGFTNRQPVTRDTTDRLVDVGDSSGYYINSGLVDVGGLQLLGILAIPRSAVMGRIDANNHRMVILLAVLTPVALLLSCILVVLCTMTVSSQMSLRDEVILQLQSAQRAEAASEYKTKFLCQMSHDLRTPVACIIGLLDILMNENRRDPQILRSLREVRHCALQLLDLLSSVFDLSKVESGRLSLDISTFDLRHELESLSDLFAVLCSRKGINLAVDLHDELPQFVRGDCSRFRQIHANLLANAVKATKSGCVVLRARPVMDDRPILDSSSSMRTYGLSRSLTAVKEPQPAGGACSSCFQISRRSAGAQHAQSQCCSDRVRLTFEVEDSGPGVEPEMRDKMFSPFSQGKLGKQRGGYGLGLSIVSSLVALMDGHIAFVQKDTEGALVRFDLVFDTVTGQPAASSHVTDKASTSPHGSGAARTSAAGVWPDPSASRAHSFTLASMSRLQPRRQVSSDQQAPAIGEIQVLSREPAGLRDDDRNGPETCCLCRSRDLSPNCCLGMQAFVAMADDVSRVITAAWLRRKGFWTEEVKTWGEIQALLPTVAGGHPRQLGTCQESKEWEICAEVCSGENEAKPRPVLLLLDVALASASLTSAASVVAALEALRVPASGAGSEDASGPVSREGERWSRGDVTVAWLVDASTSAEWRIGLQEVGYGLVVSRPLHPSRLTTLLMAVLGAGCQSRDAGQFVGRAGACARGQGAALEVPQLCQEQEEQLMLWSSKGPASPGEMNDWHTGGSDGSPEGCCGSPAGGLRESTGLGGVRKVGEGQMGMGRGGAHEILKGRDEGRTGWVHEGHRGQDEWRAGGGQGGAHEAQTTQDDTQVGAGQEDVYMVVDVRESDAIVGDGRSRGQGETAAAVLGQTQYQPEGTTLTTRTHVPHTLPLIAPSSSSWPLAQRPPDAGQLTADRMPLLGKELAGLNILLVEDTVVLRRVATAILTRLGAEVFEVENGRQAVDAVMVSLRDGSGSTLPEPAGGAEEGEEPSWVVTARSHVKARGPFAVVIMDCQMPVMDGYEATQHIRKLNDSKGIAAQLPIVALTAHSMTTDEESCLAIGMSAYLTKPLNPSLLVPTIARLLHD